MARAGRPRPQPARASASGRSGAGARGAHPALRGRRCQSRVGTRLLCSRRRGQHLDAAGGGKSHGWSNAPPCSGTPSRNTTSGQPAKGRRAATCRDGCWSTTRTSASTPSARRSTPLTPRGAVPMGGLTSGIRAPGPSRAAATTAKGRMHPRRARRSRCSWPSRRGSRHSHVTVWRWPDCRPPLNWPLHPRGEMAERLKALAWKACVGETLPWVRIPLSPPTPVDCPSPLTVSAC